MTIEGFEAPDFDSSANINENTNNPAFPGIHEIVEDDMLDNTIISLLENALSDDDDIQINRANGRRIATRPVEFYNHILDGNNSSDDDTDRNNNNELINTDNEELDEEYNEELDNPYMPLEDEDFGDFIESTSNVALINSNTNISIDNDESINCSEGSDYIANPISNVSDQPITPSIQPLTKDKIELIKSIMANINLKRKPGLDNIVETIISSKIRLGDELL